MIEWATEAPISRSSSFAIAMVGCLLLSQALTRLHDARPYSRSTATTPACDTKRAATRAGGSIFGAGA